MKEPFDSDSGTNRAIRETENPKRAAVDPVSGTVSGVLSMFHSITPCPLRSSLSTRSHKRGGSQGVLKIVAAVIGPWIWLILDQCQGVKTYLLKVDTLLCEGSQCLLGSTHRSTLSGATY